MVAVASPVALAQTHVASRVSPGMQAVAHPELLPLLYPPGTQTLQSSSYDLAGGNYDGVFGSAFTRYVDDHGERVIFDAYGPGCLYRQQMNIWTGIMWVKQYGAYLAGEFADAGKSRLRFYFDDEPTPRIDMSVDDYFNGSGVPFGGPWAFKGRFNDFARGTNLVPGSTPFAVQYYPLPFAKRLKITFIPFRSMQNDSTKWYQFTYHLYPQGTPVTSWSKRTTPTAAAVRAQWTHLGDDPKPHAGNTRHETTVTVPPHGSAALLDARGQGAVASLKLRMTPYSVANFYRVRLRMTWDAAAGQEAAPAVDLPIGVFFGGGAGDYPDSSVVPTKKLTTLFYGFDGAQGTFYSYWPMPYWASAKIEVVNDGAQPVTLSAAIEQTPKERLAYPKGGTGYFYAKETKYADRGHDLFSPAFEEHGYGHVVGLNFYTYHYSMDGDEFTFIDGSGTPQVHGNGTEDDHDQGWGGTNYQQPLWGGLLNGYQGAYRTYMNDAYVFDDQIRTNYEYSQFDGTTDSHTDIVVYYYKASGGSRLRRTDELDVGQAASEQAHRYTVVGQTWAGTLRSAYDAYEKGIDSTRAAEDDGRAFNGKSAFTVAVDPRNVGVRLRRRLSRFQNGVQTAAVYVDGKKVARRWHVVFNSSAPATQAWVDSDFELPAALTRGKSTLRIEVRYLGATQGAINEFHYWVFSHLPSGQGN